MADGCPDGFYRDRNTGTCKKSIQTKRKDVYGQGFLSEPQSEQYAKIRQEEKVESPELVDEQMAALNSWTSRDPKNHPAAHEDLEYAESLNPGRNEDPNAMKKEAPFFGGHKGGDKEMPGSCGPGEEFVEGYKKADGTEVAGYCRKAHNNVTAEDREKFSRNGKDAKNWEDRR